MTIKVFEFTRSWADVPVTIFASGMSQAEKIYHQWLSTHHADQPADPDNICIYNETWVAARPHLAKASALGASGIGYWSSLEHRWMVGEPQSDPLGYLAPPEPSVRYFRAMADEGDDARVFATNFEEATSLYCAWHLDRWGELPARFTIHIRSRWELAGGLVTLRDDMEEGIVGIAGVEGEFLRILPPDHEPILPKKSS